MLTAIDLRRLARVAVQEQHAAQRADELAALGAYLVTPKLARPTGRPNALRRIVEIGSYQGGTLWFWRQLAPDALIVAIDREIVCQPCRERKAHTDCPRRRIADNADFFYEADSGDSGVIRQVRLDVNVPPESVGLFPEGAGIDLLFIDGDHSFAAVERDFQTYMPMLSAHGVVVLHDIAGPAATLPNDGNPQYGVAEFWANIRKLVPQSFEISSAPGEGFGFGVIPRPGDG